MSRAFLLRLRGIRRDTSGAMLVEAAIVLPLVLLFMGLVTEAGRLTWIYQVAAGTVRDASRLVARIPPENFTCPPSGSDLAEMKAIATDVITDHFVTNISDRLARVTNVEVTPRCVGDSSTYRGGPVLILEVRADVEITFTWGGVFGLFGDRIDTVETQIFDQSRVYGV